MPKIEVIRNPFLNAVCYDICFNLPEETKKKLSIYYRRILASQTKTKNFCENSSIDTKLKFFHAVGLSNALTIFPDPAKSGAALKSLLKKYDEERMAAAQKEHAQMNVYVTTDKQTSFLINLMGDNINTKSFLLNLDYNKTGYHIKQWAKKLDTAQHQELLDTAENAKVVGETVLNSFLNLNSVTTLFGINEVDIQVLLFFYTKMNIYISRETVWDKFQGYLPKKKTTMSMKRLLLNEYTVQHPEWQHLRYTLSAKGVDLVMAFIKQVFKHTNFN